MSNYSLCRCGCGQMSPLATRTDTRVGHKKGYSKPFIQGHQNIGRKHKSTRRLPQTKWYRTVQTEHDGRKHGLLLHRVRAERALGKPLSPGAEVHHADGSKRDDAPLVICQDKAYHRLLHMRTKVKLAGGNPNTDLYCGLCAQAKPKSDFGRHSVRLNGHRSNCRSCESNAWRRLKLRMSGAA